MRKIFTQLYLGPQKFKFTQSNFPFLKAKPLPLFQFSSQPPNTNKKQKIDIDLALSQLLKSKEVKQKIKINSPQDRLKLQEEKWKKINLSVVKRELICDSIQLPIKSLAYMLAGNNKGAFLAELIRSGIDATNHIILFAANHLNLNPSKEYPYGLEKIKNMVVMIPAILFLVFGVETIWTAFHELFQGQLNLQEGQEIWSLLLYVVSIGVELTVIGYNLIDTYKVQQQNEDSKEKISIITIFKALFKKKDPLLQAILYENLITLSSMSVPFTCAIISQFYTSIWIEFFGSTVIGSIQLFCAYHLGKENVKRLLGESVESTVLDNIVNLIKDNEFIVECKEVKAVMIGSVKFRFFAEVTYDIDKITRLILKDYKVSLESIIYSDDYEDREDDLNELLMSVPIRLFKEIQKQKDIIESSISEAYPECLHIDLEMQQEQLLSIFDDEEKVKNYFQDMALENTQDIDINEKTKKWLDKEIDYFLLLDWSRFYQKKQSASSFQENSYNFLRRNTKFYNNHFSSLYIEEQAVIHEKMRKQLIEDDLKEHENNYWQNKQYPFDELDSGLD